MNRSRTAGAFARKTMRSRGVIGYYRRFRKVRQRRTPLSPSLGYVIHVFLTRSPLTYPWVSPLNRFARLACLSHAASVRSEPGSNSSLLNRFRLPGLATRRWIRIWGSHSCARENESCRSSKKPAMALPGRSYWLIRAAQTVDHAPPKLNAAVRSLHTLTTTNLFTCQRAIRYRRTSISSEHRMLTASPTLSIGNILSDRQKVE